MTNAGSGRHPVLRVRGLHVRYRGGIHAVRGVDLDVEHGRVLAVVGESGCGKTTLAGAVLGLLPQGAATGSAVLSGPGHDDVELIGRSERSLRPIRGQRIGYVAQNPFASFDPLRTVGHHVVSAWRVHGRRPAPGEVARLVEPLGIVEAQLGRHPHTWSGGMLQRAAIAAATALGPELIVADEPTSALDADLARTTLALLRGEGRAVLLVSHDLTLVSEVADEVAVLYGGEVMEQGPARQVASTPHHPYTRALLAAVPTRRGQVPIGLPGQPPDPRLPRAGCAFVDRCPDRIDQCAAHRPALAAGVACHLAVGRSSLPHPGPADPALTRGT